MLDLFFLSLFEEQSDVLIIGEMSLSKCQLSAGIIKWTCLSLDDKIKVLDYKREHPKTGVREIATHFHIVKTAAANVLKDAKKLKR